MAVKAESREIWGLRRDGDPAAALDRALEVFESHWQDSDMFWDCWYEHFAGSRCLLLDFARATRSEPDSCARGLERLEQWAEADTQQDTLGEFLTQRLKRRIDLLRKIQLEDRGTAALAEALREAALACGMDFPAPGDAQEQQTTGSEVAAGSEIFFGGESDQMARGLPENDSRPLPAFLRRLEPREKWLRMFGQLGQQLGWHNPGLLMVGQLLVHVYGKDDPTPDDRDVFKTWVLLAGRNAKWPTGVLARLLLRRLSGGCGGFFPDACAAGYLRLEDDFKSGLIQAWKAAFGTKQLDFDVAWSLHLIAADAGLRSLPIGGRSAEAAIYCALRALDADQRLDQRVAVTASLKDDGQGGTLLAPVGAIEQKTLAEPLRLEKITEIVVSAEQPEILRNHGREVEIANGEIRLIPAANVDQAYQHLVRWERITSHVRKKMAEAAERLIEELCGQYVVPSLSRPKLRRTDGHHAAVESFEPLSKDEVSELLYGRLKPSARILLLADSGLGKSMYLLECQHRIANRPDGPLPVRLVGLSEFPWNDPVRTRHRMADALAEFLPKQVSEADRWQWFERLVDSCRAVFLLDALDQTIVEKLDGLSGFLAANMGECPVLMTGRPYVIETRHTALKADWSRTQLDKFDELQQREFLGQWADRVLVTAEEDDYPWNHLQSIARKRQWADLVHQPLLLKMLRDLAEGGKLTEITNQHSVYQRAVEQLIEKGWETLKESESKRVFHSRTRVKQVLRHIAWNRAQAGDFQGVVSGEELDEVISSVTHRVPNAVEYDVKNALDQMNIVTCGGIVESGQEDRLAWRHLSFCEYFAGLELARGYPLQRMMTPAGAESFERQPANEFAAAVQDNARAPDWHAVFRYALSQLAASDHAKDQQRLSALAVDLIQFGNPFVVTEAIRKDGIHLLDELDRLCRWLACRDETTHDVWTKEDRKPQVDSETLALLDSAFVFGRRDSRYLHAAWELVVESELGLGRAIRARFLGEFPKLLASGDPTAMAIRDGFQEIPPIGDPLRQTMRFAVGEAEGESKKSWEMDRRYVSLSAPFEIARTPVTNAHFELFALRNWRGRTKCPDCPAGSVSWYEAELYCLWLGDFGDGRPCRLPTEIEWEIAARAGSEGQYCRVRESDGTLRDVTTEEDLRLVAHFGGGEFITLPVANGRVPNAWGLHDMLGNVEEWCADRLAERPLPLYGRGQTRPCGQIPAHLFRVYRGGSFSSFARGCRSACRGGEWPWERSWLRGFRPARSSIGSSLAQPDSG